MGCTHIFLWIQWNLRLNADGFWGFFVWPTARLFHELARSGVARYELDKLSTVSPSWRVRQPWCLQWPTAMAPKIGSRSLCFCTRILRAAIHLIFVNFRGVNISQQSFVFERIKTNTCGESKNSSRFKSAKGNDITGSFTPVRYLQVKASHSGDHIEQLGVNVKARDFWSENCGPRHHWIPTFGMHKLGLTGFCLRIGYLVISLNESIGG